MTLIVETGAGVRLANAYVDSAYVTSYLAARNRSSENSWNSLSISIKEAAIIAATDYIEKRFSHKFLGQKQFAFDDVNATCEIQFLGAPSNGETIQIGDQTYTFVDTLSGSDDEVLIGATGSDNASNLADAVNAADGGAGVVYGLGTAQSRHTSASASGGTLTLTATAPGSSGLLTALVASLTNTSVGGFTGGLDGGSQPLSFPRLYLYDRAGIAVEGVPLRVREATCEYAVRAAASPLMFDPTVDSYGGSVVRRYEKVGPIEQAFDYAEGSQLTNLIKPYPAADRLLYEYMSTGSSVYR